MSFPQSMHVEQAVEENIETYWDFVPSDGGVPRQNYAVMSIVAPQGTNQKCDTFGIKIFGCFNTEVEATAYSKKLQQECNFFDIYVCETKAWVKLPPQVEQLENVHYQEEEMEKLKKSVLAMRKARAEMLERRVMEDRQAKKKPLPTLQPSEAQQGK